VLLVCRLSNQGIAQGATQDYKYLTLREDTCLVTVFCMNGCLVECI